MNPILKAGLLIGLLCAVWMFVFGFAGWYRDQSMTWVFFLVILIQIAGLVWGLRATAREGRTYGGQIVAGAMMSIVAGVIVIGASLVFTMVAFPDALEAIQAREPAATPMSQALDGFLGTLVTGIVASAVIAIWIRAARPIPQM
jgi:hypothetical protein